MYAAPAVAQRTTTTGTRPPRTTVDPESAPLAPPDAAGDGQVAGGMGGTILRLGLGLLVVVGLILAVWFLMRRAHRGRFPGAAGGASTLVDVVSTTPLGPNRFLHLVRVGEDLILIGATDHTVTPVARIGGGEAVDLLGADVPAEDAARAFNLAGDRAPDPRVRAAGTARDESIVERLRSLTARR